MKIRDATLEKVNFRV